MIDEPGGIPLPDEVTVPMDVLRSVVAAGERAIEALPAGDADAEAGALDEALGALSTAILRAMGIIGDEE